MVSIKLDSLGYHSPPGGQGVFFDTLLKKHDIMKEKMTRNKILRIKE